VALRADNNTDCPDDATSILGLGEIAFSLLGSVWAAAPRHRRTPLGDFTTLRVARSSCGSGQLPKNSDLVGAHRTWKPVPSQSAVIRAQCHAVARDRAKKFS
jgi:hypothetical protein